MVIRKEFPICVCINWERKLTHKEKTQKQHRTIAGFWWEECGRLIFYHYWLCVLLSLMLYKRIHSLQNFCLSAFLIWSHSTSHEYQIRPICFVALVVDKGTWSTAYNRGSSDGESVWKWPSDFKNETWKEMLRKMKQTWPQKIKTAPQDIYPGL